ncbi:MAG: 16S rRNA (cytosine(1402)-N(4))-methyltransferase RsmH [Saprospiraceae bacterium]|nr:16S rRNA (cytosine(1402)-N(4))-methyltransferase RsmH [Saprospiraceae bacterium]
MAAVNPYHAPVMCAETIESLVTDPHGVYVDATFGGGGHSAAILQVLDTGGRLFAFDQDLDAFVNKVDDQRLTLIHGNFRFLKQWMRYYDVTHVHGVMADLGVSSFQLDEKSKGFSYASDADLDMRMNIKSEASAFQIINETSEGELVEIFSRYGEVRNAKTLAKAIVVARALRPIKNVQELLMCIGPLVMGNRSRYLAQVFQAIRIKVNDEIGSLRALLSTAADLLVVGGRLSILTYHSIEDRLVKHFMKSGKLGPKEQEYEFEEDRKWYLKMLSKKPILPTREEVGRNRRARSAKLRIAEKIL